MPVLGITGGIATGKTLFTSSLAELGPALSIFNADACARELTAGDPGVRTAIRAEFGESIFDAAGQLRRQELRDMIFSDSPKRKALEAILHPAIRRQWLQLAGETRARGGASWLLVDIPLLFETAAEMHFDKVVTVACTAATQRQRLMDHRHLSPTLATNILASQLPLAEKVRRADFVIWNEGAAATLRDQAALLFRFLLA